MKLVQRRHFLLGSSALLASPLTSFAQQPREKVSKVGFLISETASDSSVRIEAMRSGLRDHGYVEGKNLVLETRTADGNYARLPELAATLVQMKVDVLVAFGTKAVLAARRATSIIPIVDPVMGDPVASGLVSSLARPGGNITGLTGFDVDLPAKRVELLKEAVPTIARLGIIVNPLNPSGADARAAATRLGIDFKSFDVPEARDFEKVFAAMLKVRVDSILVSTDTLFQSRANEVASLAMRNRLPSVGSTQYAEAGGLIGYSANDAELFRREAYFVHKILMGSKPGDLPIERPTRFEMVVNAKTAKGLGIAIPKSILIRTDREIQ